MDLVELSVLVPEDRIIEFYIVLGKWLGGRDESGEANARQNSLEREGRLATRPSRRQSRGAATSRYAGMGEYLKSQSGPIVEVSFEDLEESIGGGLPASAERHRAWWANTERNTQARVWMDEGWRVDSVDFDNRQVTFSRS